MDEQQYTVTLKKPEKIGAMVVMAALVGAIGYGLFLALPMLIQFAQDSILFGVEVVVGVTLAYTVLTARETIALGIALQIRKLLKKIIHKDPIGVLSTVITRFQTKLDEIDQALVDQDAARKRQANNTRAAKQKADYELSLAAQATATHLPDVQVQQHVMAADRWQKLVDSAKPQSDLLDKMQTALEQARDLCAAKLDDFKSQKAAKAMQLDMAQSNKQVVSRFKTFFGSNPDLELQDMALDDIERQTTEAEAEVDQLMRFVNPMLQEADLKKQADASAAMAKFGQFISTAKPQAALPGPTVDGIVVQKTVEQEKVRR